MIDNYDYNIRLFLIMDNFFFIYVKFNLNKKR